MLRSPIPFAIFSAVWLASCAPKTVEKIVPPHVPDDLRAPVTVPQRAVGDLAALAALAIDYDAALVQANCQLGGIDTILRTAEDRPQRGEWRTVCPTE